MPDCPWHGLSEGVCAPDRAKVPSGPLPESDCTCRYHPRWPWGRIAKRDRNCPVHGDKGPEHYAPGVAAGLGHPEADDPPSEFEDKGPERPDRADGTHICTCGDCSPTYTDRCKFEDQVEAARDLAAERDSDASEAEARAEAAEAKLEAVGKWARDYPLTDNPNWSEYIKAQHDVEYLLAQEESEKPPRLHGRSELIGGDVPLEYSQEENE